MHDPVHRIPAPDEETHEPIEAALLEQIGSALGERHGLATLTLDGRLGPLTGWLRARVGPQTATWEVELFVREVEGEGYDGPLGVLVDFLDGFLAQWVEAEREGWASLDWEGNPYDLGLAGACVVFVRGEVRDLVAERAGDALLGSS